MNLMGALRRTMATSGYSDLKEFQRVEVVVTRPRSAADPSPPARRPRRLAGRDTPPGRPAAQPARAGRPPPGVPRAGSVRTVMAGGGTTVRLGPAERAAALAELAATEHEVLVVGGGIVGAAWPSTPPPAGCPLAWSRPGTSDPGPRRGQASSSTAASATLSSSTSGWSGRRWRSGHCCSSGSHRTWCARCPSSSPSPITSGSAST